MAASSDTELNVSTDNGAVLKTGLMYKQGGSYKNWRKRYFVLYETFLSYYAKQGDTIPKGNIDLTMGRGVRLRNQCDLEWPKCAKPGLAFGLAIEERTYYFYGDNREAVKEWMALIQMCIYKIGQPCDDYRNDPEGKREGSLSKMMKGSAKLASKVTKMMTKNAGVDEPVNLMDGGADDAMDDGVYTGRNARCRDRLKLTAGDSTGDANDVDTAYVSVHSELEQEQRMPGTYISVEQRLLMETPTTLRGSRGALNLQRQGNKEVMVARGVLTASSRLINGQADADEHWTLNQRMPLAGETAIRGNEDAQGTTLRENFPPLTNTQDSTRDVMEDQTTFTAAVNNSLRSRGLLTLSRAASGLSELEYMKYYSSSRGVQACY